MSTENAAAVNASPDKTAEKRKALGRGLESLLPSRPRVVAGTAVNPASTASASPANENGGAVDSAANGMVARASAPVISVPQGSLSQNSAQSSAQSSATAQLSAQIMEMQAPVADIPAGAPVPYVIPEIQAQAARGSSIQEIPLDQIDNNPYQTRVLFREEMLEELAESIQASGVVQPIVVRPGEAGRYMLVMGERRCRASKMAGKATIPAIVRKVSEQQAAEMTVIENLQRQDLNCMEQAAAFAKLSIKFGLTQEEIGKRVGLARETVSNYMRLLKLPGTVMQYLQNGDLGFSEARLLLQFQDQETIKKIADEAVKRHLSVDGVEQLCIQAWVRDPDPNREPKMGNARWVDPNVRSAQREIQETLGLRVKIQDRKGKGKIVIEYATLEDFDRVVEMLKGK
jgi:ParB family transcriptional regulator, chromosome partitioning protein